MNVRYQCHGSAALKPSMQKPQLELVKPGARLIDAIPFEDLVTVRDPSYEHARSSVEQSLDSFEGKNLFETFTQRVTASAVGLIACAALFYFSFFAF